jgi:hypothetical protein
MYLRGAFKNSALGEFSGKVRKPVQLNDAVRRQKHG